MCKFCENYNFGNVGYKFALEKYPKIYFPGGTCRVPENERFKFCPACGKKLIYENAYTKTI